MASERAARLDNFVYETHHGRGERQEVQVREGHAVDENSLLSGENYVKWA